MKHEIRAAYKNTLLRPLCDNDLESLRTWRNETKVHFLAQLDYISPEMQKSWFERDNSNPSCYTFGIEETLELKRLVGSVALYNIEDGTAECGRILIGDSEAHGRGIGYLAILMSLYIGFQKLGLSEITADVHADNFAAVKNNTKAGFVICGEHLDEKGYRILEITAKKDDFYAMHNFLDDIELA